MSVGKCNYSEAEKGLKGGKGGDRSNEDIHRGVSPAVDIHVQRPHVGLCLFRRRLPVGVFGADSGEGSSALLRLWFVARRGGVWLDLHGILGVTSSRS